MDFNDGGAASLLGDEGGAPAGAGGGGGDEVVTTPPAEGTEPAGGPASEGEADPAWLEQFSGDPVDGKDSHRDWLKSAGIKDLDGLAKVARDNMAALRSGDRIVKPKDGAPPDEIAAYHRSIGVPEAVDKYELPTVPDGAELDMATIEPLREVAFKAGVPAEGFKALAAAVVAQQIADQGTERTRQDGLREEKLREWGNDKTRNMALFQRGCRAFGIDAAKAQAIQRGMGSDGLLDFGMKLGQLTGEDGLLGGGGQQQFGMTGEQAQAKIDEIIADATKAKAVTVKGSAEEAEWNRLNAVVAHYKDLRRREEQG